MAVKTDRLESMRVEALRTAASAAVSGAGANAATNAASATNRASRAVVPTDPFSYVCRQRLLPKTKISFKFNVTEDDSMLVWSARSVRGVLMLAINRRAMTERTTFTSKVSEFNVKPKTAAAAQSSTSDAETPEDGPSPPTSPRTTSTGRPPLTSSSSLGAKPSKGKKFLEKKGSNFLKVDASAEDAEVRSVIAVFEEVAENVEPSEDPEAETEQVEKARRVARDKTFSRGSVVCESGFTYEVCIENRSSFFPAKVLEYDIRLVRQGKTQQAAASVSGGAVRKRSAKDDDDNDESDTAEELMAKIEDLLHFVGEISSLASAAKPTWASEIGSKKTPVS
jgi:hypothetical protein